MEGCSRKIAEYCSELASKRITVLGMGISNLPLITFLHDIGVKYIRAVDKGGANESTRKELIQKASRFKAGGIIQEYSIGEGYLDEIWKDTDVIFKTPVVRFDIPELTEARKRGVRVTSEMEEFLHICPAKIYAVTGSDGKTTTTTLIYKMLSAQHSDDGNRVWVGGNIGRPLFQYIKEIKEKDFVVLELSSFQLMNISVSPDVAVITNISPNHLDVHKSYEEYIDAKKNIFINQKPGSVTVVNADNDVTSGFFHEIKGECRLFSYERGVENGVYYSDGNIILARGGKERTVMDRSAIRLPGRHNVENFMAAISAVAGDVGVDAMRGVASDFSGVEHRLEFVRELDGVKYYNSSIDSSPNRTIKALSVFPDKKIVMIAGGKDKKIPYDDIGGPIADKVKVLILTGPTAEKIEAAVLKEFESRGQIPDITVIHCASYAEAVRSAKDKAETGDIVLLSPASTSFDMFSNFEERGNLFKRLVNEL